MKSISIAGTQAPAIIQGCARIGAMSVNELEGLIHRDLKLGINPFDHVDTYGKGVCEELFGKVLEARLSLRRGMLVQSKCGIHRNETTHCDFSKDYILRYVDASLKRLQCEYLDYLLPHRPDALMDPLEVAQASDALYTSGKMKYSGVNNHNPYQTELLKKYSRQPIEISQIQLSAIYTPMVGVGVNVNTFDQYDIDRDNGTLDYCGLQDITIQCWSPFQYGMFEGVFLDNPKFPEVDARIRALAKKCQISSSAIVAAWLLRHPTQMQVILGSVNTAHIEGIVQACDITLTREEWCSIYVAAGNLLPQEPGSELQRQNKHRHGKKRLPSVIVYGMQETGAQRSVGSTEYVCSDIKNMPLKWYDVTVQYQEEKRK